MDREATDREATAQEATGRRATDRRATGSGGNGPHYGFGTRGSTHQTNEKRYRGSFDVNVVLGLPLIHEGMTFTPGDVMKMS